MKKLVVLILLPGFLFSCREVKNVEFIKVQKVEFNEIQNGNILAVAHAVFNNPNSKGGKVKKVDIDVFVRDKQSAKVLREEPFKVMPDSQFVIPLDLEIGFEDIAKTFLSNLLSKEREKSIPLHFKGNIWVTVYGVTRKVPVDYEATLKYKL